MSSTPWYAWYAADHRKVTSHLNLVEDGAMRRLLDHYYATARPLPNDMDRLMRITSAHDVTEVTAVKAVIAEFFSLGEDGLLHNRKADKELIKQKNFSEEQSRKGRLSAQARWGNKSPNQDDGDNRSVTEPLTERVTGRQPKSNLSQSQSQSHLQPQGESERRDRSGKGGKTTMPDEFAVSDRVRTWAEKKNYGHLDRHLEHFRLQATARGYTYADWDSALMKAISSDWAGLRINGHDRSAETLADLLAKDANGQPQAD